MILTIAESIGAQPAEKNPGHLKMGLVNLKCLTSDGPSAETNRANIQANLKRHLYFIDELASQGVEFVGFPELSVNGYHFSKTMTWLSLMGPEVQALRQKAAQRGVYVSAGLAEEDAAGKHWNTQVVIDPKGAILGWHHKIYLTKEKGFTEAGTDHKVFEVKGLKMGIAICADGSDRQNLQALVDNGARLIYGPHANTTGGTSAGWYKLRAGWEGPEGWIAQLKVYAALHNHAGLYNPSYKPPSANDNNTGWASGALFLGPDGRALARMQPSSQKSDSKEFVLTYSVPIPGREAAEPAKDEIESITYKGVLIRECSLPGERRGDDVVPAHPNGIQVSGDRWLLIYATRGFRGVDDDRSIVYQLRRGTPDGPVIKEGMLARSINDWDPSGDGKKVCVKQHGHPVAFGVPKGALIDGTPAPSANVFVAKWRIVGRMLDKEHDYLQPASIDPDLHQRTQGVQWVQFRLNPAEDDIEILRPVTALRQKGFERGDAFCSADIGAMNQSFTQAVPFNRQATEWADCNHFEKGLAVLKYTFDPKLGVYEWTAIGPVLADKKMNPFEASLVPLGKEWAIASRVSGAGVGWVRTRDPFTDMPALLVSKDPPASGPRTAYRCADGVMRLFGGDASASPHKNARDPLYCWDIDPDKQLSGSQRRVLFDSVKEGLPIRKASQPKVDMCKLLPPQGRTQLIVFRVIPRSLGRPYGGYTGKPSNIPIINKEEKECAAIYYSQITYRKVMPAAWEFAGAEKRPDGEGR